MTKKELRAQMKSKNLVMSAEERLAASERIFRQVEQSPAFDTARCVALFCSLPDEPSTQVALTRWGQSKRLVIPRVDGTGMRFFYYNAATICKGAFGIPEPGPAARSCEVSEIDLIVVPGVAFTRSGARLGRGRAFYDKYLSQPDMRAVKVGVCYAHQLVDALPLEPHDVTMDRVCAGE